MGREGFEPPKAEPTDLQSVSINHSDTYPDGVSVIHLKDVTLTYPLSYHSRQVYLQALVVTGVVGFEPTTNRLTADRSTTELHSNKNYGCLVSIRNSTVFAMSFIASRRCGC